MFESMTPSDLSLIMQNYLPIISTSCLADSVSFSVSKKLFHFIFYKNLPKQLPRFYKD